MSCTGTFLTSCHSVKCVHLPLGQGRRNLPASLHQTSAAAASLLEADWFGGDPGDGSLLVHFYTHVETVCSKIVTSKMRY